MRLTLTAMIAVAIIGMGVPAYTKPESFRHGPGRQRSMDLRLLYRREDERGRRRECRRRLPWLGIESDCRIYALDEQVVWEPVSIANEP